MKIDIIKINQWWSNLYFWKMKFSELKNIVRFHIRWLNNEDWINRETDSKRIKNIASYIFNEIDSNIPLFSTPLVISLDERDGIIFSEDNINIPEDKKNIWLIIDWQHRFKWIELYYNKYYNKYNDNDNNNDIELPIIFLLDFDLYQLSEIFVNINFKQKPVNKSLYYDIFWSLPPKDWVYNELQYSHEIVKMLNTADWSPIKGIIKMLWNKNWLVSQSFIVDIFTIFFRRDEVWWIFLKEQDYTPIEKFLKIYFSFIKEKFKKYNYTEDDLKFDTWWHILWKTTGFGAILYLIQDIFQDSKFDINWDIKEYLNNKFKKLSDEDINKLFSKNWEYAWSWWLQSKLYRELSKKIFYNSWKKILKDKLLKDYKIWDHFNLGELYSKYRDDLKKKFPNSSTIDAKIRRLLQILRDEWYIEFLWKGNYKLLIKNKK